MNEEQMPAAEAVEANAYELAFHVLPTVAEGEVATVVDAIKSQITSAGGEITGEESPARFELAYEIVKHLEGRNRKFTSAYFGWVRFTTTPDVLADMMKEVEAMPEILRAMVIKLTKVEEANPFMFHESIAERKVETVEIEESDDSDDEDEDAEVAPGETVTDSDDTVDGEDDEETV